jgi:putative transposase
MTVSKTIPTELLDALLSGYQEPDDLIGERPVEAIDQGAD